MTSQTTRVLLVDDDEDDYIVTRDLLDEIVGARFAMTWVDNYEQGLAGIKAGEHDVYLIDYRLGEHNGLELLREAVSGGCRAPIILLTGQGDHEVDVEAMKAGASDYLVKSQIGAPLLERSIRYALERKRAEESRDRLIAELQAALTKVKTLSGFLPICAACKKIRDDSGYWNQLEAYIEEHSQAEFSHGICPDCAAQLYPSYFPKTCNHEAG